MASGSQTDLSLDFTSQKSDTILMISEMSFLMNLPSSGLENDKKFFIVCGALFSSCSFLYSAIMPMMN